MNQTYFCVDTYTNTSGNTGQVLVSLWLVGHLIKRIVAMATAESLDELHGFLCILSISM